MEDFFSSPRNRVVLTVAIVALLAGLGLSALAHLLREVHLHDVKHAFAQIGPGRFAFSIALTIISYFTLTFYDVLALRAIDRPLPFRTAALASFTNYTLSHNLGLSLLTGGSARYRIYSAEGLAIGDVARIVVIAGITFWGGVFTLAGAMLAFSPDHIAIGPLSFAPWIWRCAGVAILTVIIGAIVWAGRNGRHLHFWRWTLPIPGYRIAMAQIAVAALDLAAASAALFVLLPNVTLAEWPVFFMGYTLAIITVLITHVPGGVGVFEAVIVSALPSEARPELVAALLAYRLIYYVFPLLIAGSILAVQEGQRLRHPLNSTLRGVHRAALGIAPTMMSALVFLGGVVLLISGSLPSARERMAELFRYVPLPLVEASHLAASLVGAALLILSPGLYRRMDSAFWLTRALLLAGAAFSLLKGLDYEEAAMMLLLAALLQWTRASFSRHTRMTHDIFSAGWFASVAVVLGLSIWIGLFAYKRVDYRNELWWRFAKHADASRFLRASLAVGVLLGSVALLRLLRPTPPQTAVSVDRSKLPQGPALTLAQRADANLAFTGDKKFLTAASGRAFAMYQVKGHSWIVMGDPVGDPAEWSDLLWTLREEADAAQGRLLLYQISRDTLPLAIDLGLQIVKYGEEARVNLNTFILDRGETKSLRDSVERADREGMIFEVIPAAQVPKVMDRLREISDAWLKANGRSEKGFSAGRFNQRYLAKFDCAIVRHGEQIVAFANIWTTPGKTELSIDLMRHDRDIPYGTLDFLLAHLMEWGKQQCFETFVLGMAPSSGKEAQPLTPLWVRLGASLYERGEPSHGVDGLRSFKDKFAPAWEPRFIAGPQGGRFARALVDLLALISPRRGRGPRLKKDA